MNLFPIINKICSNQEVNSHCVIIFLGVHSESNISSKWQNFIQTKKNWKWSKYSLGVFFFHDMAGGGGGGLKTEDSSVWVSLTYEIFTSHMYDISKIPDLKSITSSIYIRIKEASFSTNSPSNLPYIFKYGL